MEYRHQPPTHRHSHSRVHAIVSRSSKPDVEPLELETLTTEPVAISALSCVVDLGQNQGPCRSLGAESSQ